MAARTNYAVVVPRFALAVLGVLGACQGKVSSGSVEAADFCEEYVDVVCEGLESCCDEVTPYNDANCRREQVDVCNNFILTVDDRGIAPTGPNTPARIVFDFDEEGAAAALKTLRSQFGRCGGTRQISLFDEAHFLGEPGAECLRHEDCVEGARCEQPPLAVFGTCVMAPQEGEPCEDVCAAPEIACVADDSGDLVCVGPRKEGQSCDRVPCEEGLICMSTAGTPVSSDGPSCIEGRRIGQSCESDSECLSLYCHAGRCDDDGNELFQFCDGF